MGTRNGPTKVERVRMKMLGPRPGDRIRLEERFNDALRDWVKR